MECPYLGRECEYWEDTECVAIFLEQCPIEKDLKENDELFYEERKNEEAGRS